MELQTDQQLDRKSAPSSETPTRVLRWTSALGGRTTARALRESARGRPDVTTCPLRARSGRMPQLAPLLPSACSKLPLRNASTLCTGPSAARGKGGERLLPALMLIGSIKTGSSSLWSVLVDYTDGVVLSGGTTHKGEISRKEKDFFGDPAQWRLGRGWYERIWPRCPRRPGVIRIGIDATPAYHVWHDAPKNMAMFFGARLPALRLVWMLREPVDKFWSYFWELKSYRGEWDNVSFDGFVAPKHARAAACLKRDAAAPLWPPSLPPPFDSCAPHLDHGLFHPQLLRWLQFFDPSQLLFVLFAGYVAQPAQVVRDVLLHAGAPIATAERASQAAATRKMHRKMLNSRSRGHGTMPARWWRLLRELYAPSVERLYAVVSARRIAVSPCELAGTRFLDPSNETIAAMGRGWSKSVHSSQGA